MAPTDPEARRFVADSMVVRVAVRAPDGRPFITPYWFVTVGSQICITTGRGALLARYLDADPHALLLFAAERAGRAEALLRLRANGPGPRWSPARDRCAFRSQIHPEPRRPALRAGSPSPGRSTPALLRTARASLDRIHTGDGSLRSRHARPAVTRRRTPVVRHGGHGAFASTGATWSSPPHEPAM